MNDLPSARYAALAAALAPISDAEIDDALRTLMQAHDVLLQDIDESTRRAPDQVRRPTSLSATSAERVAE